jgi:hypothetical protein
MPELRTPALLTEPSPLRPSGFDNAKPTDKRMGIAAPTISVPQCQPSSLCQAPPAQCQPQCQPPSSQCHAPPSQQFTPVRTSGTSNSTNTNSAANLRNTGSSSNNSVPSAAERIEQNMGSVAVATATAAAAKTASIIGQPPLVANATSANSTSRVAGGSTSAGSAASTSAPVTAVKTAGAVTISKASETVTTIAGDTAKTAAVDAAKAVAKKAPPISANLSALIQASAGAGGGIFSTVALFPLDLVKTRIQAGLTKKSGLVEATREIIEEQGVQALFSGLNAKAVEAGFKNFAYFYAYDVRENLKNI